MSNSIKPSFIDAVLADACYVHGLTPDMKGDYLADALSKRLTLSLAKYVGDNFTVVSQYTDHGSSGFSVTVFKDNAGQTYVSMRGTEPADWSRDFPPDINAYLGSGLAESQIVEMVNWYMRAKTAANQPCDQYQYTIVDHLPNGDPVYGYKVTSVTVAENGALVGAGPLLVNGHSLGGHLATIFTRLFNSAVSHSSTFNGLGVGRIFPESLLSDIQNKLDLGVTTWESVDGKQSNYFAQHGINVATNDWWLSQRGQRIGLFNEEQTGISNHGMYKLTDLLALGHVLGTLDSSFTLQTLNAMVSAGSNRMVDSYESVVDALTRVLLDIQAPRLPAGDAEGSPPTREAYHAKLAELLNPATPLGTIFQSLAGKVTLTPVDTNLATQGKARVDFQTFVALETLSPFVINPAGAEGRSALEALWVSAAWQERYQKWLADKNSLNAGLTDLNYSNQWYEDRSALLHAVNLRNQQNQDTVVADALAPADRMQTFQWLGGEPLPGQTQPSMAKLTYRNTKSESSVPVQKIIFGTDGNNKLEGNDVEKTGDHLYGNAGDDELFGYKGDDYLEGGIGNDTLDGGDGADQLVGGAGNDSLSGGAGLDLLVGGSGNDTLEGGSEADLLYGGADNDSLDGGEGHDYLNGGSGADTLEGGGGNDYLFDQGGRDTNTLRGDDGNDILEVKEGQDGQGVAVLGGGAGSDILIGANGNNSLNGDEGNDVIRGGSAMDIIQGGDGADFIDAAGGNDRISGGPGSDYLKGGAGNDTYVYDSADFGIDLIEDSQGNNQLELVAASIGTATWDDARGVWISGGHELRKYSTDDGGSLLAISGVGDGKNVIYIKDWQEGQFGIRLSGQAQAPQKPQVTLTTFNSLSINKYVDVLRSDAADGGQGNDILIGSGANSVLSGGVGNDMINSGAGDDWLEGGIGNDVILTGSGKDVAHGGEGNDYIRAGVSLSTCTASWHPDYMLYGIFGPYGNWGERGVKFRTDDNTQEAFYYYVNGLKVEIAHPELSMFDLEIENTVAPAWAGSKMAWQGLGTSHLDLAPSIEVVWVTGDTQGGKKRGHEFTAAPKDFGAVVRTGVSRDDGSASLAPSSGQRGVRLHGGAGNDVVIGANDHDVLHGDEDDDQLAGFGGDDELYGGVGDDHLSGGGGRDFLDGGHGRDIMFGGYESDVLYGGQGNDDLIGDFPLLPQAGSNVIDETREGDDILFGGAGDDKLLGGGGSDRLFGEADMDTLMGGFGDDYLDGGAGNDSLNGNEGNDLLFGGAHNDVLEGDEDDDYLDGGADNDTLVGGDGNDILFGGDGKDTLYGDRGSRSPGSTPNPGKDILRGGKGQDLLDGGDKDDMYIFSLGDGQDTIVDSGQNGSRNSIVFQFSKDKIRKVAAVGMNLVIEYGVDDVVTVKNYYGNKDFTWGYQADAAIATDAPTMSPQRPIASVLFDDGARWDTEDILALAPAPAPQLILPGNPFQPASQLPYFIESVMYPGFDGYHHNDKVKTYKFATTFTNGEEGTYLFTDEQKAAVRLALSRVSEEIDLDFVEYSDASVYAPDITFFLDDLTSAGMQGYAGYANQGTREIHINSDIYAKLRMNQAGKMVARDSLSEGYGGFSTIMHEVCHILGLKHPFEGEVRLPSVEDSSHQTIMSYTEVFGALPAKQLAPFDVQALQYMYGVRKTIRTGDDVYTLKDRYIADKAGSDGIDASLETEKVYVNLKPGSWNYVGEKSESILAVGQSFIGYDTIIENAMGGAGDDTLIGNDANNILTGNGGSDALAGGKGQDLLLGGAGRDKYLYYHGDGQDVFQDNWAEANVLFLPDYDVQQARVFKDGNDAVLVFNSSSENSIRLIGFMDGNASCLYVQFKDKEMAPLTPMDVLNGFFRSQSLGSVVHGAESNDFLQGHGGNDHLYGEGGNDIIEGGAGDDSLKGGAGDDVLDGGQGNDTLAGDVGNNTYRFGKGDGQDVVLSFVDTTAGKLNTLAFKAGVNASDVVLKQTGNGDLQVLLVGTADGITLQGFFAGGDLTNAGNPVQQFTFADGAVWSLEAIRTRLFAGTADDDVIRGTVRDDTIGGGVGNDSLSGGLGNDSLEGGVGHDLLDGGAGADSLSGGAGDDSYIVDNVADQVVELANEGIDTVQSSVSYSLSVNVENLTLTGSDNLSATGNELDNVLTGNSGNNALSAGAGNDTLIGGTGIDTMSGGMGNDVYHLDSIHDVVVESANEGQDTVYSMVSNYVLSAHVENLVLGESDELWNSIYKGTGNDLDNTLTGNKGNNRLDGGGGADTMIGGLGDDTYVVEDAGDVIVENANEGVDTVEVGFTYTLADKLHVENIVLTGAANVNATGNAGDNDLWGNSGDNVLDGAGGSNRLAGGAGNDTYFTHAEFDWQNKSGDRIIEQAGEGTDTIIRSYSTYRILEDNVENLTLVGNANYGNGNELDNVIRGSDSGNTLAGLDGNDTLIGGSGNDGLLGGAGGDLMIGGAGDDIYYVDDVNDVIVENAGEGDDMVWSTVDMVLGANLERLGLQGNANLNATGNELANGLWGNAGDNTLTGGKGNDYIEAGAGNDTIVFNKGDGQDTIKVTDVKTAVDTLRLQGIDAAEVGASKSGNHLFLSVRGGTDQIAILDYYAADTQISGEAADGKIDKIVFDNGTVWDQAYIDSLINRVNHAPTVNNYLPALNATSGQAFSYTVAANTITDPDPWDSITYKATMADGSALPAWLNFDPATRTFSGTPQSGNVGSLQFILWGYDTGGQGKGMYVNMTIAQGTGSNDPGSGTTTPPALNITYQYTLSDGQYGVTLSGNAAYNIKGNAIGNKITGNDGANVLNGAGGNDTLIGGKGNDTYVIERGTGSDTVQENDATAGNKDAIQFGNGITADQLWFRKVNNNLEISIIGGGDKVTVQNWYLGNQYRTELFKTADGKTLTDASVSNLVNAMAAFAPPASGQATLPQVYQETLNPVIAANWR
ncbi:MAG: calcium-binding protein [Pseudomonadota bacterium]|nr:calcium-binding protein [Pseudomonadota bacterium]